MEQSIKIFGKCRSHKQQFFPFLIICFCYSGIWAINLRLWDPLPTAAYQGKGIHTFDIKYKWLMRQYAWECLDMSKILINNFRVSVMLPWTVTLNLCRCVTVYGIKIDITMQYKYIISKQKCFTEILCETPNF